MKVVIALGSNLGDRQSYIDSAVEQMGELIVISKRSTLIETDPVGGPEQGRYLNGVVIGDTDLSPEDLMKELLAIEEGLGRIRTVPNGPRTIDLDLIDYQGMTLDTPILKLPHPRAHERAFVLMPWLEIDPEACLPGIGPIAELVAGMDGSGVERMDLDLEVAEGSVTR